MKTKHLLASFSCAAAAAAPVSALAHVGADGQAHHHFMDSLVHALAHPFTGLDHLAAMVAVGAWSALVFSARRSAWRAPAAFVAMLLVGAMAGLAGLHVPAVEPMIAASVLVLGLLVMVQKHMHWGAAAGLAGVFAFFHGAAHGYELAEGITTAAIAALIGIGTGSALLHISGMVLGHAVMQRHHTLAKLAGGLTAALGAVMLTRLA